MGRAGASRSRVLAVVVAFCALATQIAAAAPAQRPAVGRLSGSSAGTGGGLTVLVHGSGFSHVRRVTFGGAIATKVRVRSTHLLSVVVPRHKPGKVDLHVVTAAGTSATVRAGRFTYVPPPSVLSVSPDQVPSSGGSLLTVTGKNFLHVKEVRLGGQALSPVHVRSATLLTVVSPRLMDATAALTVRTAYGTSAATSRSSLATVFPGLAVTTTTLPAWQRAVSGTVALTATGGFGAYHWRAAGLPVGVTLSADGVLAGTTYQLPGVSSVVLTVTDDGGHAASATLALAVSAHVGTAVSWGSDNAEGELGDGTVTAHPLPAPVFGIPDAVQVAGSSGNGYALRADGTVWSWGDNLVAQIGDGTAIRRLTPVQVPGLTGVVAIAPLRYGAIALLADGTVRAWGYNGDGELGDGTTMNRPSPVTVLGLTDIVRIAASRADGYAVDRTGNVYAWGYNGQGEVGDGSTTTRETPVKLALGGVASVSAAGSDAFALRPDGTVYGWGDDLEGGLGFASATLVASPQQVPGLTGVVAVSLDNSTSWALHADGTVMGWGYNVHGELGDGTMTSRSSPVTIAGLSNVVELGRQVAQDSGGLVFAWGQSDTTDLANGGVLLTPVVVHQLAGVTGVTDNGGEWYGIR